MRENQCELTGWLPRTLLFHYISTFLQASCSACFILHGGCLLGLLVNPEDGSDMMLPNAD
jgi:hypothetical protein